ncbi:MAG: hypothetical protein FH749_05345 [Firmicutes bacterium]|nr:hypothetical protein [Bacillota bacterium]
MSTLKERVSYIRGLAEGLNLDSTEPNGKVLTQMLELLAEMADQIEDLDARLDDTEDVLEALDSDLADVEEFLFDEDEADAEFAEDELSEFEIQCPHCDEIVYVNEDDLEEVADDEVEILCPNCNKVIFSDEEGQDEEAEPPVTVD